MSDRILVVAGARALDVSPAARLWAMRELAARVLSGRYTTVVQGRCAKSPDEWADELAKLGRLVRIAWPIDGGPLVSIPVQPFGWHVRDLRDAARYPYQGPLPRNEAMALWAGDQRRAGHDVDAVTLRCDWPAADGRRTNGTGRARDYLVAQLGADRVTDLVCPLEYGPGGDTRG